MKHIKIYFAIVLLGLIATSCSETLFDGFASDGDGEKCELTLPIESVLPEVKVVTRSGRTESEEKRLNDLQILVFSSSTGKLKGYKHIKTGDAELNSSTYVESENKYYPQNVTVKTTTGSSYVYAVANCSTQDYKITVPDELKEFIDESTGIFKFDEDEAQAGECDFYLTQLQKLGFSRVKGEIGINDGYFLMCGMIEASEGVAAAVNIKKNDNGKVYVDDGNDLIKLRRMVSKVKFNIADKGVYTSNDTTYTFTLQSYEIYNVPTRGNLVQGMTASETADYENNEFEALTGLSPDQQTSDYTGFIVYLPENMQTKNRKNTVSNTLQREANELALSNGKHVFTNAPDDATYVILNGLYDESYGGSSVKSGNTSYMIHLGDFNVDPNDYNNERNYYYTYTVHVQGVNRFIVEAKKEGDSNPGAEGFISAYSNDGKKYTLDSHYEYCIMRFYQEDIKKLKTGGHGYSFAAYGLTKDGEMAETQRRIEVKGDSLAFDDERLNGVDISWVHFFKNDKSSYYNSNNDHGGTDPGFKNLWDSSIDKKYKNLSVGSLLSLLYNNAEEENEWPYTDSNDRKYVDYTCYIDENFYTGKTWDTFTNKSPRRLCIANTVYESEDRRSVYADGAFYITQRAIQTFYNRNMATERTAYGCETIDETVECEGADKTTFTDASNGDGKWNGRTNMISDNSYNIGSSDWPTSYTFPNACMKRNRDSNHNGKIDNDEIRWYTPTVSQYTGLWIGQPALEEEAQLYYGKSTKTPDIMHYYTSTQGERIYWAEEGMAAGNWTGGYSYNVPKNIRCIRNLPKTVSDNRSGADNEPDRYYNITKENTSEPSVSLSNQITYTYRDRNGWTQTGYTGLYQSSISTSTSSHYKIDMSRVDPTATTSQTKELARHHEYEDGNKVAKTFYLANSNLNMLVSGSTTGRDGNTYTGYTSTKNTFAAQDVYYNRTVTCNGNQDGWRVPNQRELAMIYIGNSEGESDALTGSSTFCATYYSGMSYSGYTNYRKSWRMENGKINMGDDGKDFGTYTGYVRCIKVVTQ